MTELIECDGTCCDGVGCKGKLPPMSRNPTEAPALRARANWILRAEANVDAVPQPLSPLAFANAMTGLQQLRKDFAHECSPETILALLDERDALLSRLGALEQDAERLRTPDIFWLRDDSEVGVNAVEDFRDMIEVGEVALIDMAHHLPSEWIAHVVIPETETSDEDSEIQVFATEAEARAAISRTPSDGEA